MEDALYHPAFGYYTAGIREVGRDGDFSTSATLSGLLARAIAVWLREERRRCFGGETGRWHIIEIGPGNGLLHRDILRALGSEGRRGLRCHLVERSPALRRLQKRRLWRHWARVSWHDTPADALKAAGGDALIFSNELIDAFPVTLLQRDGDAWREVWLELFPDGKIGETLRPVSEEDPPVSSALDLPLPDGQRIEIHQSVRRWMLEWLPCWKNGAMLTIDYGDIAEKLYHRRPRGTLRGYRKHRRVEGLNIYQNIGTTDLTADVNFTDLIRFGGSTGLLPVSLEPQHAFISRRLPRVENSPVNVWLQNPAGPGGAFQCLTQRRLESSPGFPPRGG